MQPSEAGLQSPSKESVRGKEGVLQSVSVEYCRALTTKGPQGLRPADDIVAPRAWCILCLQVEVVLGCADRVRVRGRWEAR